MDIARNELYITALHRVIASALEYRPKPWIKNGRACDAFVYVLEGGCRYEFADGSSFIASPGDLIYLAEGSCYTMHLQPGKYGYIYCDFSFAGDQERTSCRCASGNPGEMEALFCQLLRAYRRGRFTESLSLLYRVYGNLIAAVTASYVGKYARAKLEESRKKMDWSFSDPALSVRALAEEAGMSEVYYRKLFRTLFHTSPSSYLISARIRAAEEMMQFTSLPLKECALRSGFSSVQYFCRVYRKKRGVTPSRWRKENRSLSP